MTRPFKKPIPYASVAAPLRKSKALSTGEEMLALHIKAAKLIGLVREFQFHPVRKWRADFAFPDKMLLVEVEGGVWTNGRHTRGAGYISDLEKYNEATLMGYRVLRFAAAHIQSGAAIASIERALE